ncbi:hypothetical protein KBD69_05325 [Candidatus Woesebacteria bacterium]|nr:hypothetical protein [Candidatus Woesebacteria bacterium]
MNEVVKIYYPGDCLLLAFRDAGFKGVLIEPWFKGENLQTLCTELGLKLHTIDNSEPIELGTPVILIYDSEVGPHAEFLSDIALEGEKHKYKRAIIEIPKEV